MMNAFYIPASLLVLIVLICYLSERHEMIEKDINNLNKRLDNLDTILKNRKYKGA